LGRNSIGLLFCDADFDGAALTRALREKLGFDIAGMTTLATLDPGGRRELSAVLTVLTADDCDFQAAVSGPLFEGDHADRIRGAYEGTRRGEHGAERAGVIFAFCPNGAPFSGDIYPNALSEAADGAPVIGGVAADDYDYERARVFLSGAEYRDSLVVVAVRGNVRPVFSLRHVTSRFAERIRRIERASDNVVYQVGGETFVEYLKGFGLRTDVSDPLLAFNSYPMMLTREDGDETPLMRHISGLNHEDGSGSFFGDVPEGSLANMCLVSKEDVMAACGESADALLAQTRAADGYEYSTVLCISCCGRAMILGADSGAEGEIISRMLPGGMSLAGAYCLGEICPAKYEGGAASNRFHNCSITFCAI
jgi:hypothetical protein